MKAIRAIATGAALIVLGAAALAAQDTVPEPERPQARMRMHAFGTGQLPGMTPMQRRQRAGLAAQRGGSAGERGFAPRALLAQREFLGLSEAQVADLERLNEGARAVSEKALEQSEARQERLAELWKADRPDVAAIRRESQELMKSRQEAWLASIDAMARAKAALTAEQLGKVEGLAQGRRMGQRHGATGMRRAPAMRGRAQRGGARGFAPRRAPRRF
ncbi:MAG: hypothetical protein OER90_12190 [Gemmatimonadota bacterium]|nr:hypothetical protein [Gemmatimonadota bacterium]